LPLASRRGRRRLRTSPGMRRWCRPQPSRPGAPRVVSPSPAPRAIGRAASATGISDITRVRGGATRKRTRSAREGLLEAERRASLAGKAAVMKEFVQPHLRRIASADGSSTLTGRSCAGRRLKHRRPASRVYGVFAKYASSPWPVRPNSSRLVTGRSHGSRSRTSRTKFRASRSSRATARMSGAGLASPAS